MHIRNPTVRAPRRASLHLASLATTVSRFAARASGRRALAGMSDAALKDIGLTRIDALREAAKPFWRP